MVVVAALVLPATACTAVQDAAPNCGGLHRLGLMAQAVPTAAFVPCIDSLPPGWSVPDLVVRDGEAQFSLLSDRAKGHAVKVRFGPHCAEGGGVPVPARAPGARSYLHLTSVSPRYSGTLYDKFAGGCVSYTFDFERGPHIALVQTFETAVRLFSRHELRLQLHKKLGLELGS